MQKTEYNDFFFEFETVSFDFHIIGRLGIALQEKTVGGLR